MKTRLTKLMGIVSLTTACLLSTAAFATAASAQETVIGADLRYVGPLEDQVESGWGFGLRLGQRLDLGLASLTGEIVGDYHAFGGNMSPHVLRGMLGGRIGIGAILRPFAFAHAGIGRLSGDTVLTVGPEPNRTSFTFDVGGGLDFTLLPLVTVGAHIAYNRLAAGDYVEALSWIAVGLHVELVF